MPDPVRKPSQWNSFTVTARVLVVLLLCGSLLFFFAYTLHWPMMVDSPVMHYVTFLTEHGMRPYADITDNNMPGAYLLERFAISIFGGTDLGWRLYDYFLLLSLIGCMVVISAPVDWLAGLFAGGLFALRHGSEGSWFAGEREQEMAVLLIAACAFLFLAVRRRRPFLLGGFGFLVGMAASIKPTLAPFALLTLFVLANHLQRQRLPRAPYLTWGVAGLVLATGLNVVFLLHYHALAAFLFVLRTVTPVYAGLNHPSIRFMVVHIAPFEFLPLVGLALLASVLAHKKKWNWEKTVLLLAAANGLFSYFLQGKGFYHHRYIFVAFLLLLLSLEIFPGETAGAVGAPRFLAITALLYAAFLILPIYLHALMRLPKSSALTQEMQADLQSFGVPRLQKEVQCFDLTFGCLNSLYHLQLVENTGFTGDLLLFPHSPNAASDFYRQKFWTSQKAHPASVIVLTNQEFGADNSYTRLTRWPEFSHYLEQQYRLATQRSFPLEDRFVRQPPWPPEFAPGYRIYLRNGFTP